MKALGPYDLHKMLDGFEDKSAQAVATFAYSEGPDHEPILFQGRTDVRISYFTNHSLSLTIADQFLQGKLVPSRGPTVFGKSVVCRMDDLVADDLC
jgi:inosine triphosphate pyrophosphatase